MKEFSFLNEKKQFQEYITPKCLRNFITEKVGKCNTVFDPAVGSGQLVCDIDCVEKLGNEINIRAVEYAEINGIITTNYDYILYDDTKINYDVAVSNYPFSLRPTEEHKKILENHFFFKNFTNNKGKFVGCLDFIFILKSFLKAERGFYLCFPGITYRNNELKYRKYLIENRFIKEIGIIINPGFKDTNIDILYMELNKNESKNIIFTKYDMKSKEKIIETVDYQKVIDNEYNLSVSHYIKDENIKKHIPINEIEEQINTEFYKFIDLNLKLDEKLLTYGMNDISKIENKLNILKMFHKKYSYLLKKNNTSNVKEYLF